MKFQFESILKQRSQHQPQLIKVGLGIFRFSLDIEKVRANPTRSAGYLELLNPIGETDQFFQRYVFPAARAVTDPTRRATSCMVRLHRRDREFRPRRSSL